MGSVGHFDVKKHSREYFLTKNIMVNCNFFYLKSRIGGWFSMGGPTFIWKRQICLIFYPRDEEPFDFFGAREWQWFSTFQLI